MTLKQAVPVVIIPGLDGTYALRAELMERIGTSRPTTLVAYPDDSVLDYPALDQRAKTHLPHGPFVVLGESFGGPAAIKLAHDMPERAVGLILASTFARHPWPTWLAPAASLLDQRLCPDFILEWIMLGTNPRLEHRRVFEQVTMNLPKHVLQARARAALLIDTSAQLAATACPVLCIHGRFDQLIPARCAHFSARLRPGTKMSWLDGAHDLLLTHAVEAATAIEAFCGTLDQ